MELVTNNFTPHFVDMSQHITIKSDYLPHWHQQGKTQFVTFRLADSLPQEKLQELDDYKKDWLKLHPQPWDKQTAYKYEQEVRKKTEKWLDAGYGSCILGRSDIRKIVSDSLFHFNNTHYYIHHFVIMPNHVHLLITPIGENTINITLGKIKRYTANAINKVLGTKGEIWQRLIFDHMVRDQSSYEKFVNYINDNPRNLSTDKYTLYNSEI